MPLVLNARNNTNYVGNLINQKYSPLEDIQLHELDRRLYQQLFTNREQALANINVYPPDAIYFHADWPVVSGAVNVNQAPMVVICSNRANWMQTILQNAVDHGGFTGYLDNTTFNNDIVPWYAPQRSGRPVYIVVHWSEYRYYAHLLKRLANIVVVGYKFTVQHPSLDIVGFGASGYAALQLMIELGYHRAWAVEKQNGISACATPQSGDCFDHHGKTTSSPGARFSE